MLLSPLHTFFLSLLHPPFLILHSVLINFFAVPYRNLHFIISKCVREIAAMQKSNLKLKKPAHTPTKIKVVFSAQAILDSVLPGQNMMKDVMSCYVM